MPERSSPCSVRLASSTLLPLLAEATYDGFYGHADLLAATGVAHTGHYATSEFFLASTTGTSVPDAFFVLPLPALLGEPWCWESNWMGYVAVATDEGVAVLGRHDIVVVWRGTVESLEWVNDLDFTPTSAAPSLGPAAGDFDSAVVHHGYLSVYTSSDEDSKFNQQRAGPEIRCRCRCRKTPPVKHVELQMHAYMDI